MLSSFVTGYLASLFSGNRYLLRIYLWHLEEFLRFFLVWGVFFFFSVLYTIIPLLVGENKTKGNNIWGTLE